MSHLVQYAPFKVFEVERIKFVAIFFNFVAPTVMYYKIWWTYLYKIAIQKKSLSSITRNEDCCKIYNYFHGIYSSTFKIKFNGDTHFLDNIKITHVSMRVLMHSWHMCQLSFCEYVWIQKLSRTHTHAHSFTFLDPKALTF